jgi:hypothetical protein
MSSYGPLFEARSAAVRSEGICHRCRHEFHPSLLDAHHPIPRKQGGSDWDLIPLCDECHPIVERETKQRLGLLFYLGPPRYRLAGHVKRDEAPRQKVRARVRPQPSPAAPLYSPQAKRARLKPQPQSGIVGYVRATPPPGLYGG